MTPMALTDQAPNLVNLRIHQISPNQISSIGWKTFNIGEEFFFTVADDAPRGLFQYCCLSGLIIKGNRRSQNLFY